MRLHEGDVLNCGDDPVLDSALDALPEDALPDVLHALDGGLGLPSRPRECASEPISHEGMGSWCPSHVGGNGHVGVLGHRVNRYRVWVERDSRPRVRLVVAPPSNDSADRRLEQHVADVSASERLGVARWRVADKRAVRLPRKLERRGGSSGDVHAGARVGEVGTTPPKEVLGLQLRVESEYPGLAPGCGGYLTSLSRLDKSLDSVDVEAVDGGVADINPVTRSTSLVDRGDVGDLDCLMVGLALPSHDAGDPGHGNGTKLLKLRGRPGERRNLLPSTSGEGSGSGGHRGSGKSGSGTLDARDVVRCGVIEDGVPEIARSGGHGRGTVELWAKDVESSVPRSGRVILLVYRVNRQSCLPAQGLGGDCLVGSMPWGGRVGRSADVGYGLWGTVRSLEDNG